MTDKTDIELMQQALDSMLDAMAVSGGISDKMFETIKALRERLLQPEPRNQCGEACERAKLCAVCLAEMTKQPEQRPLINPPACTWTHDDDEGSWDADCGERWSITEGTPEENNFRFCPGCGRTVKTIFVTPRK